MSARKYIKNKTSLIILWSLQRNEVPKKDLLTEKFKRKKTNMVAKQNGIVLYATMAKIMLCGENIYISKPKSINYI